jgi:hypothetical protein
MDLSLDLKQLTVDEGRSKELKPEGQMPVEQIPDELLIKAQETVEARRLGSLMCTIREPSASCPRACARAHRDGSESATGPLQSTEYTYWGLVSAEHPSSGMLPLQVA